MQVVGPQQVCGNGIVEGLEQCDDGGTVGGDGCSATCQVCHCSQQLRYLEAVNAVRELANAGRTCAIVWLYVHKPTSRAADVQATFC